MQPFVVLEGIAAPLDQSKVDTDQILPARFLRRPRKEGYGQYLFRDWMDNPQFVLNQPQYQGASILIAGKNFGCGSSREHAPWALADYGFRAIIAPSFADIFASNCAKNGILLCVLKEDIVDRMMSRALAGRYQSTIDLEACEVRDESGLCVNFHVDPFRRECLLNGWDDISLTLRHEDAVLVYERQHRLGARFAIRSA